MGVMTSIERCQKIVKSLGHGSPPQILSTCVRSKIRSKIGNSSHSSLRPASKAPLLKSTDKGAPDPWPIEDLVD